MAASRELTARERGRAYMHSTIFDAGGPTSKSIYGQSQQNEFCKSLSGTVKPAPPPCMDLPKPSDIRCTQNAGHGVVIPSDVGGAVPKLRSETFVVDGDSMPLLRAGSKDKASIPQEFWQTNVNLQWHDPRNELSRQNKNKNENMCAQELKLQELSSEIFGKARLRNASTNNPGADLLSTEVDFLKEDSSMNPKFRQERTQQEVYESSAYNRFAQNLADSNRNSLSQAGQDYPPPLPAEEDPRNAPRRRQEKNFSDLFGTEMGARKEIRGREEVNGTRACSFLDTRSEIATRNKEHWRPDQCDVAGNDLQERPNVDQRRKEAELESGLFDRPSPKKSQVVSTREMQDNVDGEQPSFATSGGYSVGYSRSTRLTDPPRVAGHRWSDSNRQNSERPMSAKDQKLAFLQSSIFG